MTRKTNETLNLIANRTSTRSFEQEPLSEAEKDVIVNAAFRAPTAGNLMMYSIIEVKEQKLKERLAITCDNQPFIAKAPYALIFVADYQKWVDLYQAGECEKLDVNHREPAEGELFLGISDALIAAQNAAIAAESIGIGSCYIGDIIENGEEHARLLNLPRYTLPIAMLVFGHPLAKSEPRARQRKYVVHTDRYERLTEEQLEEVSENLTTLFAPHGYKEGIANYPQRIYTRKHSTEFMEEMARSAHWWIERWTKGEK